MLLCFQSHQVLKDSRNKYFSAIGSSDIKTVIKSFEKQEETKIGLVNRGTRVFGFTLCLVLIVLCVVMARYLKQNNTSMSISIQSRQSNLHILFQVSFYYSTKTNYKFADSKDDVLETVLYGLECNPVE